MPKISENLEKSNESERKHRKAHTNPKKSQEIKEVEKPTKIDEEFEELVSKSREIGLQKKFGVKVGQEDVLP